MTGELSLFSIGNGLLAPTECAEALLSLNKLTQSRGLVLSPEQALALEQCRAAALEETGRLEMGQGILPELIYAFYDSPCLSPETYLGMDKSSELWPEAERYLAGNTDKDTLIRNLDQKVSMMMGEQ